MMHMKVMVHAAAAGLARGEGEGARGLAQLLHGPPHCT